MRLNPFADNEARYSGHVLYLAILFGLFVGMAIGLALR